MCNGNKLMYPRVIRSESWLVDGEKVTFIDELIDTIKDQFFKDFRANGRERHWSIFIHYFFIVFFCVLEFCYLFSSHLETLFPWGNSPQSIFSLFSEYLICWKNAIASYRLALLNKKLFKTLAFSLALGIRSLLTNNGGIIGFFWY